MAADPGAPPTRAPARRSLAAPQRLSPRPGRTHLQRTGGCGVRGVRWGRGTGSLEPQAGVTALGPDQFARCERRARQGYRGRPVLAPYRSRAPELGTLFTSPPVPQPPKGPRSASAALRLRPSSRRSHSNRQRPASFRLANGDVEGRGDIGGGAFTPSLPLFLDETKTRGLPVG